MDMTAVYTQMGILVFIMALGFICARLKVTGAEFNRSVSNVTLNVLLTFTIINSVLSTQLKAGIGEVLWTVLLGFVCVILCLVLGLVTAKLLGLDRLRSGVAAFAVAFPNITFVGFPMLQALYGPDGVFIGALVSLPFNLLVYSAGNALCYGSIKAMSVKKALSPPLVATVAAVILFLCGVKLPSALMSCFGTVSQATVPMSMLIIGTSLGSAPLSKAFTNWRVYVASFVRLVVCPVVVFLLLRLFVKDAMLLGCLTVLFSAPTAVMTTVFAINSGNDEALASDCVFISTVLSAVTMPLVINLLL